MTLAASPSGFEADIRTLLVVPHRVQRGPELRALLIGLAALALLTTGFVALFHVASPTIVSLSFLLIVLVAATLSTRRVALAISMAAFFGFNFSSSRRSGHCGSRIRKTLRSSLRCWPSASSPVTCRRRCATRRCSSAAPS